LKKIVSVFLVFLLIPFLIQAPLTRADEKTDPKPDTMAKLLADYGYTKDEIKYDPEYLSTMVETNAKMVLPWFHRWWSHPFEVPKYTKGSIDSVTRTYTQKTAEFSNIGMFNELLSGMSKLGYVTLAMPELKLQPYPIDKEEPLLDGIKFMYASLGYEFYEGNAEAVRELVKDTPVEVQYALADYCYSAANAYRYRDKALRNYPKEQWEEAYRTAMLLASSDGMVKNADALMWDLGQKFDYFDLFNGTIPLVYSIFKIEKVIRDQRIDASGISFEIPTPMGKLAFNGKSEKNEYIGDDYFLIVDVAGDDIYRGATAATMAFDHPVSVVIDFAGNDQYLATTRDKCAQAAGIFGIGILVDEEGDDTYTAYDNAQGVATWGVGLLWDNGGNDAFTGHIFNQGAAQFGVGELVNIGGTDTYYSYYMSQAFGYTLGYGMLLDTEGDDTYTAEPYKLLYAGVNGHNDNVNYTLSQGVGYGRRSDLYDGHSMGGGIGILCDLKGNDKYVAGIFSQCSAYWYGVGILYDKEGNDLYDAYFFVQSGTAHMGITELLDESGNDTYNAHQAISLGGAHDVSISWFIDKGGNDQYHCWYEVENKETGKKEKTSGGILCGSCTANGMGFFVDVAGDDVYDLLDKPGMAQQSIGYPNHVVPNEANNWRNIFPDVGIFIDMGGKDVYPREICKENTSWQQQSTQYPRRMSVGLGLDIEGGNLPDINY
jgi:hypothetical protein